MTDIENRWLSVDEICKYLGVSNDTVYKWIDKHSMPAHRMGRLWKFKINQVDPWIEAGGADGSPVKGSSSSKKKIKDRNSERQTT